MARRFWLDGDPIGKTFHKDSAPGPLLQIVGVAKQGKYLIPVDDAVSFFYVPEDRAPSSLRTLQLRVAGAPEALIQVVEREIHALAPGMPLIDVESMEHALQGGNGLFLFRMGERFAGSLGLLGLALALVGVYGVISYTRPSGRMRSECVWPWAQIVPTSSKWFWAKAFSSWAAVCCSGCWQPSP